jgi:lactate 2-monooxygenase
VAPYVQGGCGDEWTQDLNVAALEQWGRGPRMMVDGSKRDMPIERFGMKLVSTGRTSHQTNPLLRIVQ